MNLSLKCLLTVTIPSRLKRTYRQIIKVVIILGFGISGVNLYANQDSQVKQLFLVAKKSEVVFDSFKVQARQYKQACPVYKVHGISSYIHLLNFTKLCCNKGIYVIEKSKITKHKSGVKFDLYLADCSNINS